MVVREKSVTESRLTADKLEVIAYLAAVGTMVVGVAVGYLVAIERAKAAGCEARGHDQRSCRGRKRSRD